MSALRRLGVIHDRLMATRAGVRACILAGLALLCASCSGLGREVNQALPGFLRADPGAKEMAIFEEVRRSREWSESDLADQAERAASIEELRQAEDYDSVVVQAEEYLEIYPGSTRDEEMRFQIAEALYNDDDWRSAFRRYREFSTLYPVSGRGPEVVERLYEMGTSYLEGEQDNFLGIFSMKGTGEDVLEHLIETYPRSARSVDAQYTLGRYRMDNEDWVRAQADFEFLAEQYPKSEWRGSSLFYDAYCRYRQVKGAVYDPVTMANAQRSFERYLAQVEDGEFADDSRQLVTELLELQAEHLYEIGDWYVGQGKAYSARYYFMSCSTRFPGTQSAQRAIDRLREIRTPEDELPLLESSEDPGLETPEEASPEDLGS